MTAPEHGEPPVSPGGRVTIRDVARRAGVSRQTVTRAMNDMSGISEETKERVLRAAALLDYRPNRAARAMVRGSGTSLGLVIRSLMNPYFPEVAESVIDEAHARGWSMHLSYIGSNGRDAAEVMRDLAPQVDAVIGYLPPDIGRTGPHFSGPLVQLDLSGTDSRDAGFRFDLDHDLGLVVDRFVAAGRGRLAMIDGSEDGSLSVRAPVFTRLATEAGLLAGPDAVALAPESPAGARKALHELLEQVPSLDGLFVFNDVMALGVVHELVRLGVRVPDDLAVISMDGIQLGELTSPTLTSVDLDPRGLARAAVELVEAILAGDAPRHGPGAQHTLRHRLLARESG
ncbi:LacI family DNA-binding transcriptional regulator [Streptomyces litchfieldiae]|uniref:LacI family DNA-binding transcriptional regulator n=1 Tax=Streptomyces litchfieldiae TaxID=3075543 RepID=A0ABU2MZ35_9ACTN|nr:LacI family DNA-binding transcriptional regulator [Streptomyces sp. DSM 44938]MDT0345774.1 LacI family DNA-binding transcriptional regulator [Streptomyces sp. DSM 44938]